MKLSKEATFINWSKIKHYLRHKTYLRDSLCLRRSHLD